MEDEVLTKNEHLGAAFEELAAIEEDLRQNTRDLIENQQLLKASEANYRTLAENIPGIVYRMYASEGSRIQFFNRMLTAITGFTPEELEKGSDSPIASLIPPADRTRVGETVNEAVRKNLPFVVEYDMIVKDGSVRHAVERGRPVFDPEGKLKFIDGIINDVSERKQAELDLAESRRTLDTLIHNLPGLVYRCRNDPDWSMEFVSDGCKALTGYDPADLIDNKRLSYGSLVIGEDQKGVWNQVQAGVSCRKPFQMTYRICDRNGRIRWAWEQGRGIYDDRGNFVAIEGYIADISGHKHTEEALQMTNRKLQPLTGITRYDIRNQVLALRSALELVDKESLDQTTRKAMSIAQKNAETINDQIEFTTQYEHLGMQEPRWQKVREIFGKASRQFLMENVSVDLACSEYEIFADPLLEKVFYNLLDNAFRHGWHVTRIGLSCIVKDGTLKIILEDNGRGVDDEEKTLIFKRGFGKNTGLGLFLSREILSITKISITENGIPGSGARFEITVPDGEWKKSRETCSS